VRRFTTALLILGAATAAVAQEPVAFTATIVGTDDRPRPGVSVQALGPSTVLGASDANGRATFRLRVGSYEFRVCSENQCSQFEVEVSAASTSAVLRISW
jgi:hypothetical protein